MMRLRLAIATRIGLSHFTIDAAMTRIATKLGVVLSEKAVAQAVPLAGAFAGAALNWVFLDFYQDMARVHFALRQLERETGDPEGVRACFDRLVRQARGSKKAKIIPAGYSS
jgi:hypothetical protein